MIVIYQTCDHNQRNDPFNLHSNFMTFLSDKFNYGFYHGSRPSLRPRHVFFMFNVQGQPQPLRSA